MKLSKQYREAFDAFRYADIELNAKREETHFNLWQATIEEVRRLKRLLKTSQELYRRERERNQIAGSIIKDLREACLEKGFDADAFIQYRDELAQKFDGSGL